MFKFQKNFNLHVIYRHSANNNDYGSSRPSWFSHQKCLDNFLRTAELASNSKIRLRLHFVFDGTEEEFNRNPASLSIAKFRQREGFVILPIYFFKGGSALASFYKMREVVDSPLIGEKDYLYLLENDYLHTSDWIPNLEDILSSSVEFDYLSLYDHGDKYPYTSGFLKRYKELRSRIFATKSRHWRTAPSTCFSFITKKSIFLEDWPLIDIGQPDHVIFRVLREVNRRILLTPMPSLSTHCMKGGLAPVVNWEELSLAADVRGDQRFQKSENP